MDLTKIKARLGSLSPTIRHKIGEISPSAVRLLEEDIRQLLAEIEYLRAMGKDD